MEEKYEDEKPETGPNGNSGNDGINEAGDIKDLKSENSVNNPEYELNPDQGKNEIKKAVNMQQSEPKSNQQAPGMVPIFSWRTLIVIAIGAIVGTALGIVYYIISPLFSSSDTSSTGGGGGGGSFLQWLAPESTENVSWSTKIYIQLVNPGSDYISLTDLNNRAQYYATKANSLPFYQYLNKEINQQAPMYTTNMSALEQMVRIRISNPLNTATRTGSTYLDIDTPSIEVKVTAPSAEECLYLARFVPDAFATYLDAEEKDKKAQEYNKTINEIENVKSELYKTQLQMDTLPATAILDNPNYVVLKTKVDELQTKLDNQTALIIKENYTDSEIQQQYSATLETIKILDKELTDTQEAMNALGGVFTTTDNLTNPQYVVLTTKINALKNQISLIMNGSRTPGATITGLAEMIANGDTASIDYIDKMDKVNTASLALAEAQTELNALNNASLIVNTVEYRIDQIKIEALNTQLTSLWDELRTLTNVLITRATQSAPKDTFDQTAAALMQARKDLESLEQQLGYDRISAELEKKVTQDKVTNLNLKLENLTTELGALIGNDEEIKGSQYLAPDAPSVPTPVLPQRTGLKTLLVFILAGIILAWVVLNIRWIAKGMPASSAQKQDED